MSRTHGTRNTYIAGCRCDDCRNANRVYMSQYRRNHPKGSAKRAWRTSRRWEDWEDELALDYSKSAWQIAETLERTPAAVSNRRRTLTAQLGINKKEKP